MKPRLERIVRILSALALCLLVSPALGQKVKCNALEAYRKEGGDLWQAGSRLEQALRQRGLDRKEDSCTEARDFQRRVDLYVEREAKVHWECWQNESINVVGSDKNYAQPYASRMLNLYCGAPRPSEDISSSLTGSGWSYRGPIIIPIGLIIALAAVALALMRRR